MTQHTPPAPRPLSRTLEPEAMDTVQEAHQYDHMDHAAVNRVFVTDFLANGGVDGTVLDVGTGTAQIPIELCRQSPTVRCVGIDLAQEMLVVGGENVRRAGLSDRIVLSHVDAKAMPYPDGSFAAVMSNSIIHHIPEPAIVFGQIVRVTRPGGLIFVRDLLRPPDESTVAHLVATYAGGANPHQQALFTASLRAALTVAEVREIIVGLGLDPETVRQTTDRHWTWVVRR